MYAYRPHFSNCLTHSNVSENEKERNNIKRWPLQLVSCTTGDYGIFCQASPYKMRSVQTESLIVIWVLSLFIHFLYRSVKMVMKSTSGVPNQFWTEYFMEEIFCSQLPSSSLETTLARFASFLKFLNLHLVGTTSFNLIQTTYLIPAVDEMRCGQRNRLLYRQSLMAKVWLSQVQFLFKPLTDMSSHQKWEKMFYRYIP